MLISKISSESSSSNTSKESSSPICLGNRLGRVGFTNVFISNLESSFFLFNVFLVLPCSYSKSNSKLSTFSTRCGRNLGVNSGIYFVEELYLSSGKE